MILNIKSFKYRIYPNKKQEEQIQQLFNTRRFIYNYFLNLSMKRYINKEKRLTYCQMSKLLTELKQRNSWLYNADNSIHQNTLKDLDFAYQRFFSQNKITLSEEAIKKAKKTGKMLNFYDLKGHPKFKSINNNNQSVKISFHKTTAGGNIKVKEKEIQYTSTGKYKKQFCKIKIPKLGYIKIAYSRQYEGRILSVFISKVPSGKYFISICCTDIEHKKYPQVNNQIGIDLGIKQFAIFSNGEKINNPKNGQKYEQKLKREQRKLFSKKNKSNNKNKQRIKFAKVHEKIHNIRLDFLHKITTRLIKNNNIICIEDLKIKEILRNRKNKYIHILINRASIYEFRRQLQYKSLENDRVLSIVDQYFPSSQLCSGCGFKNEKIKDLNIREWKCPNCEKEHDRDINAAINILNEGLRLLIS